MSRTAAEWLASTKGHQVAGLAAKRCALGQIDSQTVILGPLSRRGLAHTRLPDLDRVQAVLAHRVPNTRCHWTSRYRTHEILRRLVPRKSVRPSRPPGPHFRRVTSAHRMKRRPLPTGVGTAHGFPAKASQNDVVQSPAKIGMSPFVAAVCDYLGPRPY